MFNDIVVYTIRSRGGLCSMVKSTLQFMKEKRLIVDNTCTHIRDRLSLSISIMHLSPGTSGVWLWTAPEECML
jgi:hypothetical protein